MRAIIVLTLITTVLFAEEQHHVTVPIEQQTAWVAPAEGFMKQPAKSDDAHSVFIEEPPSQLVNDEQITSIDEDFTIIADEESNKEIEAIAKSPAIENKENFSVVQTAEEKNSPITSVETPVTLSTTDEIPSDTELAALEAEVNGEPTKTTGIFVDIGQIFSGAPTIYSVLLLMSIGSLALCIYLAFALRSSSLLPKDKIITLQGHLQNRDFTSALVTCQQEESVLFKMMARGLEIRSSNYETLIDGITTEGKKITASLWQKIGLLNDVAMIAPMLGLLGTVLGMFYAFYDLNRSSESVAALFDGLGVSVGTTVAGLIVAIAAMIFHAVMKYRLMRQLQMVEAKAQTLAKLIFQSSSIS